MRQRAAYLALRVAVAVIGVLPEPVMRRLGEFGGLVWHAVDARRRRQAVRHMRRVGEARPAKSARSVFKAYGRYWAESFWASRRHIPIWEASLETDGVEILEKASQEGKGVIVALPHLGNWEVAALLAVRLELPLVAVAENLANRRITDWFVAQRALFGIEVVLTGAGPFSRRRLTEALAEGHILALLADRDLAGRGVEVEFFGERTTLPAGPAVLAGRTGAPLIPVGVYFERGPGHRVVVHPPITTVGVSVEEATQELAHRFEEIITVAPTQWHLVQPNWPSDRR